MGGDGIGFTEPRHVREKSAHAWDECMDLQAGLNRRKDTLTDVQKRGPRLTCHSSGVSSRFQSLEVSW